MTFNPANDVITIDNDLLCPIQYVFDVVGGKWKLSIICILAHGKPVRYNQMKRKLQTVTNTMLAQSLKDLEAENMVNRKQYNEIPPKVEYTLTKKGKSLIPILVQFANWGENFMKEEKRCDVFCSDCVTTK